MCGYGKSLKSCTSIAISPTHLEIFDTISTVVHDDSLNCPVSAQSLLVLATQKPFSHEPDLGTNNGTNAQTVIPFPHSWKTKANPKKVPKCLGQYALASLLRRKLVMAQARRIYGQPLFTPFDHGQLGWRQSFKNVDLLMAAFRLPHTFGIRSFVYFFVETSEKAIEVNLEAWTFWNDTMGRIWNGCADQPRKLSASSRCCIKTASCLPKACLLLPPQTETQHSPHSPQRGKDTPIMR